MNEPPDDMVLRARDHAMRSPCAKSKRGVVIFDRITLRLLGAGHNGPPFPMKCDGSKACLASCGKICVHAEERALIVANRDPHVEKHGLGTAHLLHVMLHDSLPVVVPGGTPSCPECSKQILDADVFGVWLLENGPEFASGKWVFREALEFHVASLRHERNKLHVAVMTEAEQEAWLDKDGGR